MALGAGALVALRRALATVHYHQVSRLVATLPAQAIVAALGLTVLCYVVLLGYDVLALRYVGRPLAWRRTALASFLAYAFSQNLGISALTGASIRYRFWSAWGLSTGEIAQGIAFTTTSFWLGVLIVGGAAMLVSPLPGVGWWTAIATPLAIALLLVPAAYLLWCWRGRRTIAFRGWAFAPPRTPLALAQLTVSTLDWALAGAVFFVLLPSAPGLSLSLVLGAFVVAQVTAVVSHVPGGLSVFEWVVLTLLRSYLPPESLLAALVVYRAIYYFLPFAAASLLFIAYELSVRRGPVAQTFRSVARVVTAAAPVWLSGATFVAGAVLLVSGSTPSIHTRMRGLDALLPLGVMEASHFVASLAGFGLLFLANGVRRRLDAAYHATVVVLAVGISTSLLKGFDWEEAALLAMILTALVPARHHFYRRASLLAEPLSPAWIASIVVSVGGAVWLGLFSFKHVDYSSDLWWQFAATADAPRFLRATVGLVVFASGLSIARLLSPARVVARTPTAEELEQAKRIAGTSRATDAHLALLGDKALLFSESGRSFIQYGVMKRSWVAVGDPVGDPTEFAELAWQFTALADRHGAWPVFYEVDRAHLPIYIDLGLTLLKLGEEARVNLRTFTLDGGHRKGLRRVIKEVERSGATFDVIPPEDVPRHMAEFKVVSDGWLETRRTREKGFSLGSFDEEYLSHFPIAVLRVSGRIVAFANLWLGGDRDELSVDLMRHTSDCPRSGMEFLFIQLMQWGRDEGYAWFNLGMAPLSGFESRALAPVWNRIGNLAFRHSEHFYNFRGLRQYKEKFDPVWEPKYLASRAGLALPRILVHVTTLIAGGLRGVVAR